MCAAASAPNVAVHRILCYTSILACIGMKWL